jgi:hypothetical protein
MWKQFFLRRHRTRVLVLSHGRPGFCPQSPGAARRLLPERIRKETAMKRISPPMSCVTFLLSLGQLPSSHSYRTVLQILVLSWSRLISHHAVPSQRSHSFLRICIVPMKQFRSISEEVWLNPTVRRIGSHLPRKMPSARERGMCSRTVCFIRPKKPAFLIPAGQQILRWLFLMLLFLQMFSSNHASPCVWIHFPTTCPTQKCRPKAWEVVARSVQGLKVISLPRCPIRPGALSVSKTTYNASRMFYNNSNLSLHYSEFLQRKPSRNSVGHFNKLLDFFLWEEF